MQSTQSRVSFKSSAVHPKKNKGNQSNLQLRQVTALKELHKPRNHTLRDDLFDRGVPLCKNAKDI